MAGFVQAIALDLDGTLTLDGRLDEEVVRSLDECADTGIRVVVVTGRIRSELGREFPTLAEHVDALVYENGAVVEIAGHRRSCAAPVESELTTALADRGHRCGFVRFRDSHLYPFRRGLHSQAR